MRDLKVRNIAEYNKLGEDPEKLCKKMGITDEREKKLTPKKLPFIVIVVDELADLILEEGKDAELPIVRMRSAPGVFEKRSGGGYPLISWPHNDPSATW